MNRYFQLFFSLLKMLLVPLLNFLTLFLGIRVYGKENWGEFISISIWIYFIAFIAKWSGQNYLLKEFSKNTSFYLNIFYSNILERSLLLFPGIILFFLFPFQLALSALILLILIFIYNSFEVLIVYNQRFEIQFLTEIIGIFFIFICFNIFPIFNLITILLVMSISYLIKIIVFLFTFKHSFKKITLKFSFKNLIKTFPFFLIGISGWLSSKCDIYVVSLFFSKTELSEYQILTNFFLLIQALPTYLTLPINKYLFRLPDVSIQKIQKKITWLAFPTVFFLSTIIWLVITFILHTNFSFLIYFFACMSCIPSFFYFIKVMRLYKENKENTIAFLSFILFFINASLMILLIPWFKILGVVISVCISQFVYLYLINKIK